MTIQTCKLTLNKTLKELQPHGSISFPCVGYISHYENKAKDLIPWHYHDEIEIVYVESGRLEIRIPSQRFILEEGECIIINTNILHNYIPKTECNINLILFNSSLITGNNDFVFSQKYISPLLSCDNFSAYPINKTTEKKIIQYFNNAFEALSDEPFGFEFIVRENLSHICLSIYQNFASDIDTKDTPLNNDNSRIRKMLTYIHRNFAENLLLSDIAKEANISERECLRCFKKTIQLSPIQYLIKYRIMQGAEMLIQNPTSSISEISTLCGFESQSNFTKIFKRFYSCTPREYRNKNKE